MHSVLLTLFPRLLVSLVVGFVVSLAVLVLIRVSAALRPFQERRMVPSQPSWQAQVWDLSQ